MRYCVLVGWLVGEVGGAFVPLDRRATIVELQFVAQQLGQIACKHSDVSPETIGLIFAVSVWFGNLLSGRCQLVVLAW